MTVMLSYEEEYDDEWFEESNPETFEDFRDSDYDNIDRPLTHLEDVGWEIITTHIEKQ